MLRPGKPVTFADEQFGEPAEKQTWKLTSVHDVSYAAAMRGGIDGDVPAQLGASDPQHGYRYLVLGLTITDDGPSGFGQAVEPTISHAAFQWTAGGQTGTTDASCVADPPTGGDNPVTVPFVSSLCSVQNLRPGQSVTGYAWFPVPASADGIEVDEPDPGAELLSIDLPG